MNSNGDAKVPYPPDTKAFLYYYTPSQKPPIAGELRLRLASSNDATSFESGSDLLGTNGQPWSRPLRFLPKYYLPLYEKLREDGLVPDELDRILSTLPSKFPSYYRNRQSLYTLNDTFTVNFSIIGSFCFITEQGIEMQPFFFRVFLDRRKMFNYCPPYTGEHTNRHLSLTLY